MGARDRSFNDACTYRKTVLENGLRIVTEEIPYFRSVSMGIWVGVGSRFETPEENGLSHFIEHMLFKGTERRSTYDISKEIDLLGGGINAFTSKELTSFYCRVLGEHLTRAADLLADIFIHSSFPAHEIDQEKSVVCQEISQLDDSPEELIHEIVGEVFWREHPLAQPILGSAANIGALDRDKLIQFRNRAYTPHNTIVTAAGDLVHEEFVELMAPLCAVYPSGVPLTACPPPAAEPGIRLETRDLEQVHLCWGAPAPGALDERRHAYYVLSSILGGGMSSRLFQEVREKRGLAYSVYSFVTGFADAGMQGIYAGCDPGRVDELVEVVGRETRSLPSTLTQDDLDTARTQIKGSVILALESSEACMSRLAKGERFFGRYVPLDEILAGLDGVTTNMLRDEADRLSNGVPWTVAALGPLDDPGSLEGFMTR